MGKFNSSLTRVKPLFDLISSDSYKLNNLFSLFNLKSYKFEDDSIIEIRYGYTEKKIPAPKSLLMWMLLNLDSLNKVMKHGTKNENSETYKKRELLFSGDSKTLEEAISSLITISGTTEKKWFILEGKTSPDIYIETIDSIFIGEAKRTENHITTKTTWLNHRDQLIRHIDSLLDQPKNIYSFYFLESKNFKANFEESMKSYIEKEYFASNLKHRNELLVERALNSFIGFVFWEDIEKHFNITFPDTII